MTIDFDQIFPKFTMSDIEEYEEDEIDITAFDWINEKVDEEVVRIAYMLLNELRSSWYIWQTRLTAEGLKPLKMTPKNFGIVRQGETKNDPVINRIEVSVDLCLMNGLWSHVRLVDQMNTRFDFGQRIKQVL